MYFSFFSSFFFAFVMYFSMFSTLLRYWLLFFNVFSSVVVFFHLFYFSSILSSFFFFTLSYSTPFFSLCFFRHSFLFLHFHYFPKFLPIQYFFSSSFTSFSSSSWIRFSISPPSAIFLYTLVVLLILSFVNVVLLHSLQRYLLRHFSLHLIMFPFLPFSFVRSFSYQWTIFISVPES